MHVCDALERIFIRENERRWFFIDSLIRHFQSVKLPVIKMVDVNETQDPGIDEEEIRVDDIALDPGSNADPPELVNKYISEDIQSLYDVFSYRHAAAILRSSFPNELDQIETALRGFRLTTKDIGMPGGNESIIPKKFSEVLRPMGWKETRSKGISDPTYL